MKQLIFLFVVVYVTKSYSRPLVCNVMCQYDYLTKFNYLTPSTQNNEASNLIIHDEINLGIKNLQRDAGLKETGIMDLDTLELMQTPRCGVQWSKSRQKRFVVVGGWNIPKNEINETVITWYLDLSNFKNINTNLTKTTIQSIFSTTLNQWSKTSLLKFIEVFKEDEANITIKFLKREHGDDYNFDGPGQVLAHAFYPTSRLGGDVHLDLDETWDMWDYGEGSISLYVVALHELGHSLGLGHSSQNTSIMYAWYKPQNIHLSQNDDIVAINHVYGVRKKHRFGPLDPKHRTTRVPSKTTTKRYQLSKLKNFFIENSKIYVYPKSSSTLLI